MSLYAELKHAEQVFSSLTPFTDAWYAANVEVEAIKSAMRLEARMEEAAERDAERYAND